MARNTPSLDAILPFLVWQFLIPIAAGWIQTVLYGIFIRAVDFNLQLSGNAYNDLGLPIDVDESDWPNVDQELANNYYVHLKHARDHLDPVKRFAYDRFGPDILRQCQDCLTIKEYIDASLASTYITYIGLLIFLMGANALGFLRDGAHWRYVSLLAVATFEVRTALRPDHPALLTKYLNPLVTSTNLRPAYLPFQVIAIIKKTAISLTQFLALLMPLYRDDPQISKPTDNSEGAIHKQLDRLGQFVAENNKDVNRLLELESVPYRDNERAKSELREALKKYMVQNVVHQEREVRNAMGEVMMKRRTGAPHGAQGTK
ncbi:hypothetical protein J3E73DRAFT_351520 [Bipolaris maydis]|nr:hypothetical protein J3E73DRAFT_351520 [Bipolaris maydis]